jgi:hypothetical protein
MPERLSMAAWLDDRRITSVRLLATNHDGLVLGKYVSAAKFASSVGDGFAVADTCFARSRWGGTGAAGAARSSTSSSPRTRRRFVRTPTSPGWRR